MKNTDWLKKKMVYVVGGDAAIESMFELVGARVLAIGDPRQADKLDKPDLLVFTGGADVTPMLYGQKNIASSNNLNRDLIEMCWFHWGMTTRKVGICRGGQFLNVMTGGTMEQDIPNHAIAGAHIVKHTQNFVTNETEVTSTHHQRMVINGNSIRYAFDPRDKTTEIAWNRQYRSLMFQPHPEYNNQSCRQMFFDYLHAINAGDLG